MLLLTFVGSLAVLSVIISVWVSMDHIRINEKLSEIISRLNDAELEMCDLDERIRGNW